MNKYITLVKHASGFVALWGLISVGSIIAQESLPDLVARIKPSVVGITTFDRNGKELKTGTGFCIRTDHIVTNKHVVTGAYLVKIRLADDRVFQIIKLLSVDENGDLALLLAEPLPPHVKALPVAKFPPRQGDKVIIVGSPLGLEGSVSDGIVAAFRDVARVGKLVQITAPISPGSSGSPVVNTLGDVIGIATLNLKGGQNLNFAISSERLVSLWPNLITVSNYGQADMSLVPSGSSRTASQMLDSGIALHNNGQFSEALLYFRGVISADPGRKIAYFWAGASSYKLRQYDDAIGFLNQAIELDAGYYLALHSLGTTYYESKRFSQALTAYERALRFAPEKDRAATIYALGLTYKALDDYRAALEQKRLLDLIDPDRAKDLESVITPNVSGYWWWSDEGSAKFKIVDDGIKVVVQKLADGQYIDFFQGVWEDNLAIGFSKRPDDRKNLYGIKKHSANQLEWRFYDKLDPKDSLEKIRAKLKARRPNFHTFWRRIQ